MAREFRLPDIGEGLTEAEIVRWLVAEGDRVDADQPVVEVETDKAVVEIPSPYEGVVLRHGGAEGDTIEVGEILVVIGEAGEVEPAGEEPSTVQPQKTEPPRTEPTEASPIVGSLSEEAEVLRPSAPEASIESHHVKALPIVRKLAREHGIDLAEIEGTGPAGRITREDVENAIAAARPAAMEAEPAAAAAATAPTKPEATGSPPRSEATLGEVAPPRRGSVGGGEEELRQDERRPMTKLRRTIAANMSISWSEVPHVTTFDDVDATRLFEVRDALSERHGQKIPLEALVVKAVLPALEAFPEFNATIDGDDLILRGARDIGIAVDTPDGLLVAVIRQAESKGVLELASEVRRLGEGARERKLGPDELTGQTFTISNIGAVGGGHGTPIVPPGTTGILSVGRARPKPIVYDDELVIAPVMPLSLSYDHRVIDGGMGRRFMALVMENLEEPALFLAG